MITKRVFLYCLTIVLSLAAAIPIQGRPEEKYPHFEHIDTRGHAVHSICRDSEGIVWVGTTNGLTTLAQLQSSNPFSYIRHEALNQLIIVIKKDNVGRLWLRTHANQILVYDPHRNHLITDVRAYLKGLTLPYANERLAIISSDGNLWLSYGKGVFCYDFKNKSCKRISMPAHSGNILALQSNGNDVFVVTPNNIFCIATHKNNVESVVKTPHTLTNDHFIILRDKVHNMWLAAGNHLYRLDNDSKEWIDINNVHNVKSIVTTRSAYTFVATTNNGLYIFSPNSEELTNFTQAPPNTEGLLTNHIEKLYYSEELDAVVVSYNKGNLSIITPNTDKYIFFSLASAASQYHPEDVISLANSSDSKYFWAGSEDGGIFRLKSSGDLSILENRYRGSTVTALFSDSQHHLWTGVYNVGLVADDGRRFLQDKSPYSIVQPIPGGQLFVAVLGNGIMAVNPITGATETVPTENPWITDLTTAGGKLYAVTNEFIYEVNAANLATKKIPISTLGKDNHMMQGHRDIYADKRGWLWMVSGVNHSPIYIYETSTGKTHTLKSMEKFIVMSICADNDGNMWCATDQGLVRITHDGKRFIFNRYLFNINYDFHYNQRALFSLENGNMVAGTDRGIIGFNPRLLVEDKKAKAKPEAPIITMLRINGEIQTPESLSGKHMSADTQEDVIYTRYLDLGHESKNLFIVCRPRGFMTEITDQYYYQLRGHSNNWLPVTNNSLTLSNLVPGEYDLILRTGPQEDDTAEEFHMMHIRIRPPFWLSPWGIALWTAIAAIIGSALFFFIRNRRNYKRQLRRIARQKQEEEKLNEMKTRFFTNISHDLRTPLTLIIAPADQLIKRFTDKPDGGNTLTLLGTIKHNADRLLTLANQILDVRNFDSNYEALQKTPTNIGKLLSEMAEAFYSMAEKRKIKFNVNLPQEQHIVQIDSDKVGKIVNNLLSNSFKFTPDGGEISLDCTVEPAEKESLITLRVADTGGGISEEELPHIFERFYYSKQLKTNHESSGIGLNIVKQYTDLMGGTISVDKNSPQGTIFTISFPAEEVASPDATQPQTNTQHPSTVLVVDDNTDLLSYITISLQDDYNVITATNGNEALNILADEEKTIDVVVSDVMMPGINGFELTKRIKNDINLSHIPVILLTAKALEEDQLEGLQMGASDYITKPFNIDILRLRINAWMERRQATQERFSTQQEVEPEELTITTLDEQLLQKAVSVVSEHMHEPDFNVDQLASILGIHRTGLNRKLQFITGKRPILFIRSLRLKRARQLMDADPSLPISQVAYKVGFNNPKLFAKHFSEEYGCLPSEYKSKNNAE